MSGSNGVLRISKKGRKKFAFGEEGSVGECQFELDVVVAFHEWIGVDETFRTEDRTISNDAAYHAAAVEFAKKRSGNLALEISTAEALDFLARLREVYDDLAVFFHPRSPKERGSPDTSAEGSTPTSVHTEMRFSVEPS